MNRRSQNGCLRRWPHLHKAGGERTRFQKLPRLLSIMIGVGLLNCGLLSTPVAADRLPLAKGDRICLVGNALGEAMQTHNFWETQLTQQFPTLNLTVRNLCFPADEVKTRPRSQNFGSPEDHLRHSKATVVMYFFGFNESFLGEAGLPGFRRDLTELVKQTAGQKYDGQTPARVVLVSPIAVENLGRVDIPNGKQRNAILAKYTRVMQEVAESTDAVFADVFHPTLELFAKSNDPLTRNSVHLNEAGYQHFATILSTALFGSAPESISAELRAAIADKNFHWFHRYRAVNGFSIYGKRGEAGFEGTYRNRDVMEREREILDQMCANRDQRIWRIAQGLPVTEQVDDSNTAEFLAVRSNVGSEFEPKGNDQKRGSLDYLSGPEQLKTFKLAEGYEIELFASEEQFPELANPVAINFDGQGRLWVATMPSYPQWQPKTKLDDKLLILEDRDQDGQADVCRTFAGGLHQPTGFELGRGGVFVATQPDVLFLKDTDGDDQADVRIRQLTGFDSADSHHGLGAFEWSPGGSLHFMEGIFKYSGVESPYGPIRSREGAVWQYDPPTERFTIYSAFNFTNPWGHVFDAWGQDFITDGTSGQHFYVTPISGHIDFPGRHGGRRQRGGKAYPQFLKKIARPSSGVEIVSSQNFPADAQGNYLVNNVIGLLGIMQYEIRDQDSGFGGEYKGNLLECSYGNFRPVDLQFGPDGALYICDWHNALIGHLQHNLRDPNRDHSHGRIWRVRYAATPLQPVLNLREASVEQVVAELARSESRGRYRARRELAQRDTSDVLPALDAWTSKLNRQSVSDAHHLLEALWVYQSHHVVNAQLLGDVLASPEPRARAAATRVVGAWRDQLPNSLELLKARVNDAHPRVRLEAVRACSFYREPKAAEIALDVLNHPMDVYLQYVLDETMKQLEKF